MSDDPQVVLQNIRDAISAMDERDRQSITNHVNNLRSLLRDNPHAIMAFALVGAEMAAR